MFLKTLLLMTYIVTKTTGFSLTDYGVGSRRLLGAGFVTETVKNLLQCRSLCQRNSLCRSLNYNPKTRECTENFKDATTSGATLDSTVRDVIYEEKQSFPKSKDVCGGTPCEDFQVCTHFGTEGICLTEAITCGDPPDVDKAIKTVQGRSLHSVTNYTCQEGYIVIDGTTRSVCDVTRRWTSTNLICIEINCGSPPDIDKAVKTVSGAVYNSVTKYTCESGYAVGSGTTTSTCKTSGWSETNLKCVVDCGRPSAGGGSVSHASTTVNSVATVTCDDTYRWFGDRMSATCQSNGTWAWHGACLQVEWKKERTEFWNMLPEPMSVGWEMIFEGTPIPPCKEIFLNLEGLKGNTHLHVSVRFNGNGRTVFNSMKDGLWGAKEQETDFPFKEAVRFTIRIKLTATEFEIYVDGQLYHSFILRLPPKEINKFNVRNDVYINRIAIIP